MSFEMRHLLQVYVDDDYTWLNLNDPRQLQSTNQRCEDWKGDKQSFKARYYKVVFNFYELTIKFLEIDQMRLGQ